MRKNRIKLIITGLLSLSSLGITAQSDVVELLDLYNDAASDVKKVSHAYLKPFGEMLGKSFNSGWYNSAGVHKLGGFDFTIQGTYIMAPSSVTSYDLNDLKLSEIQVSGSKSKAPTASGDFKASELPEVHLKSDPTGQSFTMPNGSGVDYFMLPTIQAAVGLPFHSEIAVRYIPTLKFNDTKVGLWGVGLKHSLKDYIPLFKRLPFLRLTMMAGLTKMNGEIGVDYKDGTTSGGQSIDINSSAFTTRVLFGANFPIIALYTGMGYGNAKTDFDFKGDFGSVGTDPLSLNYNSSSFDFNIGMRLRFGVFAIHTDYTVGDYSMVTGGLGINFR